MTATTLQPWARGDVFLGVTELNDPADDHAGRGRILQYDADLRPKGALELQDTNHLVGGLKFDRDGVLWAFDSQGFVVLNIHRDGRVVRRREFGARAYSHVNFTRDGALLFGEHVVGASIKPEIAARMHTTIPHMPGSTRFGDGHVWKFRNDGTLLKEYATAVHGGMGGFLGVTMSALSPDESTLVYCSETGPRLLRYDLVNDAQLPDLQSFSPPFPPGPPPMFFGMDYAADGTLYVLRGGGIHVVDAQGQTTRQIPLEGFGWALMDLAADGRSAFVASFFSGEVAKIDLGSGAKVGSIATGAVKSLAGLVEYRGEGAAS
jgi:sugar lactone lactonase YvrE